MDPKIYTDRDLNIFFDLPLSIIQQIFIEHLLFVPGTVLYTRLIMISKVSTAFAPLPKVYKKS